MNMFVGEMCCIFAYFYVRHRQRKQYGGQLSPEEKEAVAKGLTLNYSPLWFVIPASFDIVSTTLMYIGLTSVNASVMQIINCTILVWIAVFSYIYLKRRYQPFQYIGLIILFTGVAVVTFDTITNAGGSSENETKPFGVICLILSVIFGGMLMVAEEKLLSKFYAHPLQVVGTEGATGLLVYLILLFALYYVPCTPDKATSFCIYGRMEDVPRAIMEMGSSLALTVAVLITITSLGSFNFFGVSLTKCASATHRGAVNAVRPFTVWIVCLLIQWEKFSYLQLIGYLISVYGMLLYYSIIPLKFWTICAGKKEEEGDVKNSLIITKNAETA